MEILRLSEFGKNGNKTYKNKLFYQNKLEINVGTR